MKQALSYIVASIVDNPQNVEVTEKEENGVIEFTVTVDKADMGKVIGKEGKVIRAIRNVLKIPAMKENKKIHISLNEAA